MDNKSINDLIDMLDARIKIHKKNIEMFKEYGKMFQNDIFISEGQIMEDKLLMETLFNITTNQ